jgi:hypothetical protein
MTSAVATSSSDSPRPNQAVPIVILGTDTLLAALPATPVQLAHACLRAGFANAVPASWGDELIASAVLRRLPQFEGGPAIQCSCPIVAHRLLSVGGDLRPAMLGFVAPPVAIARYVRALSGSTPVRITYVGGCPGANDEAIDIRMRPDALLAMLAERDIVVEDQPRVFESILPPDRRRFRSQPGGVPTAESLWTDVGARTLVEMDTEDFVTELAQQLLTGKNVLIDAGPHLGCVCAGAVAGVAVKDARAGVVTLEPPRAMMPVVEEHTMIDLELAVPAAPRTPLDISAVAAHASPPRPTQMLAAFSSTPAPAVSPQPLPPLAGHRFSPVRSMAAIPEPKANVRQSGPTSQRSVLGAAPVARDVEGKSLPRAYVARRRPSPRSVQAITPATHPSPTQAQRSARPSNRAQVDTARAPSDAAIALPTASAPTATTTPTTTTPTAPAPTTSAPSTDASPKLSAPHIVEHARYEPPASIASPVAPEPITFFDVPRSTPPTPARESRSKIVPAADVVVEQPRAAKRPRPSVAVEREEDSSAPNRRWILVAIGVGIVLAVLASTISAIVVNRVMRGSSDGASSAASSTPPTSTKP